MKKQNREPIRRRRKTDAITAELNLHGTSIKLQIKAMPDDWIKLAQHIWYRADYRLKYGIDYFGSDFFISFVGPVLEKFDLGGPIPSLGIHGTEIDNSYSSKHNSQPFIDNMKICSGLLYTLFSYWFKKPEKKRPDQLKNLEIPEDFKENLNRRSGKPNPSAYTAICLQLLYSEYIKGYEIDPFFDIDPENEGVSDPNNFYISYVQEGRTILKNINNENLDKVYEVYLTNLYFRNHTDMEEKYKEIFNLVNFLINTYLNYYSPLFSPNYLKTIGNKKVPKEVRKDQESLHELVTKPLMSIYPSAFKIHNSS